MHYEDACALSEEQEGTRALRLTGQVHQQEHFLSPLKVRVSQPVCNFSV